MALALPESIPLYRAGGVVSTLASAFGGGLRETRLTALLGYVVALAPDKFCRVFGIPGHPIQVSLEGTQEDGRTDIAIATTAGTAIIEAKRDARDPSVQALKYRADWRILLTSYQPPPSRPRKRLRFVHWTTVAETLRNVALTPAQPLRFLALDLLRHMEEHAMIRRPDGIEVYAREINDLPTLRLFLEGHLYGCTYESSSDLPHAQYFAPHFGEKVAAQHDLVSHGVSYVARIERVDVFDSWPGFCQLLKGVRGSPWMRKKRDVLDGLHRHWSWKRGDKRSLVVLSQPRLAFHPPIEKRYLQRGKGWLSRRTFSFDDLFVAWHHQIPDYDR